jgi:hypothetical protein
MKRSPTAKKTAAKAKVKKVESSLSIKGKMNSSIKVSQIDDKKLESVNEET